MKKLTDKQEQIFEFMKRAILEAGFPPTVREIGDEFGMTAKGAYDHIKAIEKKGYIRCSKNKSRAIEIVKYAAAAGNESELIAGIDDIDLDVNINAFSNEASAASLMVPLVGRIAAGVPITAAENIDEYLPFPKDSFGSGPFFALKVSGDSMIDAGILDGDIAIIRMQTNADNGDIIAAVIEDEATLKIFKKMKTGIQLHPANEKFKPIIPESLQIAGKLAGIFRNYR
jgi:repressor LexA